MKVFLFHLSFLILYNSTVGQNSPSDFLNDKCSYETDGTGKSMGLKIKLAYPCGWTQANGDRPHVLKKFSYSFGDGSSLIQSLIINKMPALPSKQELAEMFTDAGLKELASESSTFISGRKLKIDGLDCGEVISKVRRETPVATINMYSIQYFLVYKDIMINLAFIAGAINELEAKERFDSYKIIFQSLATNTVLLSRWE